MNAWPWSLVDRYPSPPANWLGPDERAHLAGLTLNKRRHDWLLGRWAAKTVILRALNIAQSHHPAAIQVLRAEDGAPRMVAPHLPELRLSISHTDGVAVSAVSHEQTPLGIDLEGIQPRSARFLEAYFTPAERANIQALTPTLSPHLLATAIWSGKEAALKALHLGLKVDTRAVSLTLTASSAPRQWQPFAMTWDHGLLGRDSVPTLRGWWQTWGRYVLTLVTGAHPV